MRRLLSLLGALCVAAGLTFLLASPALAAYGIQSVPDMTHNGVAPDMTHN